MAKLFRRIWRYLTAAGSGKFNELADPKIQLEQAISEAQEQHRRLKEQAANVIANQKQTEMRLSRTMAELEKVNNNAQQALRMAVDAQAKGDADKAADYNRAAESFASRMIALEREISDLKTLHLQASQASDQAKAAVQQNATVMQRKLAERQKLLSQLDQAKMAEQMNTAMTSLSETVGSDVPTFDEVRSKIESRYAKAQSVGELQADSVEGRMLEVETAQMDSEAQARLEQLRSQMGLGSGDTAAAEIEREVQRQAEREPGGA